MGSVADQDLIITVTPEEAVIPLGLSMKLTAYKSTVDQPDLKEDITNAGTWTSENKSIASVGGESPSHITGLNVGQTRVLFTYHDQTVEVPIDVPNAVVTSIVVESTASEIEVNQKANVSAAAQLSDRIDLLDISAYATWSTSDTGMAVIKQGVTTEIKGSGVGTATISASWGGQVGTKDIHVNYGPHHIFITSTTYAGNFGTSPLGAHAYADNECQIRANSVELYGTFRALLSTATLDAFNKILFSRTVKNMAGQTLATSHAEMWDGAIDTAVRYDETGTDLGSGAVNVWTGTNDDGTVGNRCSSWTSASGSLSGTMARGNESDSGWVAYMSVAPCNNLMRFYCVNE